MNNEAFMNYRGKPYTYEELNKLNVILGKGYDNCERWKDKYAGIPNLHPLKLHGIISEILDENLQLKGIIEIGTYLGGLSCYLASECIERGYKPLLTFDNKVWYIPKLFKKLDVNFIVDDCFSDKSIEAINVYTKDTPVLMICDGGFKTKEFNTFAPLLPEGSIIAVHDWDKEVNMEGIQETVDRLHMVALKQEKWNAPPDYPMMAFFGKPHLTKTASDKTKVFIGVPTTGEIRTELAKWLLEILKNPNYQFNVYLTPKSTIEHNRNLIVRQFLKTDSEWLMTIDSDVSPSLNILDILQNNKKIIAPINFVWKSWGLAPLLSTKAQERGYVVTDADKCNDPNPLVEVDATGTTCLFIHREVLEKMKPPYFMFDYDENGAICLGEDYKFCQQAKELGYGIWIDKRFVTNHFTPTSLKSVNEYIKKMVREAEERVRKELKK